MKKRTKLYDLYKNYYSNENVYVADEQFSDFERVYVDEDVNVVVYHGLTVFDKGIFEIMYRILGDADDDLQYLFDTYEEMTAEYLLNWSGQKSIAPIYERYLELLDNDLELVDEKIARILLNKYKLNWRKRWDALYAEYNPLENYNMDETRRDNIDVTEDVSNDNDVYGYNSNQPSPSDKQHMVTSTTGTADKNYRSTTRKGNIGVTTSQKMLTEELEIRKYDLISSIYKDIDKVIVLSVY